MKNTKNSTFVNIIGIGLILVSSFGFIFFIENYNEKKDFESFRESTGMDLSFEEYQDLSFYEKRVLIKISK